MSRSTLLQHLTRPRRDLIPHIPQFLIEKMFHALVQDLDRCSHRAHYPASNDSLRQLQVMEAKQVNTFIEVEQTFRHVVKPK